ncbi:MAG TPA: hypothetical protein VFS39_03760 [Nitrospira sp.]|nr:hypothetical protein [Nitrospira sp.]
MRSRAVRNPVWLTLMVAALLASAASCSTLEQRWERFDMERRQEIGVKTKEYYLSEWGKPAKRTTSNDGGEVWTWEFSAYGGAQGWRKTLIFAPDATLKDFRRDYWPKESW